MRRLKLVPMIPASIPEAKSSKPVNIVVLKDYIEFLAVFEKGPLALLLRHLTGFREAYAIYFEASCTGVQSSVRAAQVKKARAAVLTLHDQSGHHKEARLDTPSPAVAANSHGFAADATVALDDDERAAELRRPAWVPLGASPRPWSSGLCLLRRRWECRSPTSSGSSTTPMRRNPSQAAPRRERSLAVSTSRRSSTWERLLQLPVCNRGQPGHFALQI